MALNNTNLSENQRFQIIQEDVKFALNKIFNSLKVPQKEKVLFEIKRYSIKKNRSNITLFLNPL